jgi:hypothetical protein
MDSSGVREARTSVLGAPGLGSSPGLPSSACAWTLGSPDVGAIVHAVGIPPEATSEMEPVQCHPPNSFNHQESMVPGTVPLGQQDRLRGLSLLLGRSVIGRHTLQKWLIVDGNGCRAKWESFGRESSTGGSSLFHEVKEPSLRRE